jgi:hypothetical protein
MQNHHADGTRADRPCVHSGPESCGPGPSNEDIFRQLIADEIRTGRLTPARRRRIVRYAAQLRLSAVDAGMMIAQCREEVLQSRDPDERLHALRLVEPPKPRIPIAYKLSVVVLIAIIIDLLVVLAASD